MPGVIIPQQKNTGSDLSPLVQAVGIYGTLTNASKVNQEQADIKNNIIPISLSAGLREKGFNAIPYEDGMELPKGAWRVNERQTDGSLRDTVYTPPDDKKNYQHLQTPGGEVAAFDPSSGEFKASNIQFAGKPDKEEKVKDKQYQSAITMLEGAKGDPSVQQAEKDLYSAKKIKSLVNEVGGDLNKMSQQQGSLFVQELAKMATGGVPTEAELKNLKPGTFESSWALAKQKIFNEPTSQNLGAFYDQYKNYIDSIEKDANSTIRNKYGRVLESYKPLLDPEKYSALKTNYIDRALQGSYNELYGIKDEPKKASGLTVPDSGGFSKAMAAPAGAMQPDKDLQNAAIQELQRRRSMQQKGK